MRTSRRLLTFFAVALVLALCMPGTTRAQGGFIGITSDPAGVNCDGFATPGTVLELYVVHQIWTGGSESSAFAVQNSGGVMLLFLSATQPGHVILGNPYDGVSVGYGACKTGTVVVLKLLYFATGNSAPCSQIRIVPNPQFGAVLSCDCAGNELVQGAATFILNPDATCPCLAGGFAADGLSAPGETTGLLCGPPVPVESSTWGAVKALYQ